MTATTIDEVWLPITGFEGAYSVSNFGRVMSHARIVQRTGGSPYKKPEAILRPTLAGKGYRTVFLTCGDSSRRAYVHHLVLETFVGPMPAGMEGCHDDGNPANNKLGNLRWDTRSGNFSDKNKHGTATRGDRHPQAKLTEAQILEARQMRADGRSVTFMASHFNVSRMTASRAASGKSWSHVK